MISKKVHLLLFQDAQAQARFWQSALCDVTDLKPQPGALLKPLSFNLAPIPPFKPYHLTIHHLILHYSTILLHKATWGINFFHILKCVSPHLGIIDLTPGSRTRAECNEPWKDIICRLAGWFTWPQTCPVCARQPTNVHLLKQRSDPLGDQQNKLRNQEWFRIQNVSQMHSPAQNSFPPLCCIYDIYTFTSRAAAAAGFKSVTSVCLAPRAWWRSRPLNFTVTLRCCFDSWQFFSSASPLINALDMHINIS